MNAPEVITAATVEEWANRARAYYDEQPKRTWEHVADWLNRQGLRTVSGLLWNNGSANTLGRGNYHSAKWDGILPDSAQRTCEICRRTFSINPATQFGAKYCCINCRHIAGVWRRFMQTGSLPGEPLSKITCEGCGIDVQPLSANRRFCSEECRIAYHTAKQADDEVPTRIGECLLDMPFPLFHNEVEFAGWFRDNYSFFGFTEICRDDIHSTPDMVMRSLSGEVWLVELEYYAPNFKRHGHDIDRCDLVIAYVAPSNPITPIPVPVISLIETETYNGPHFNPLTVDVRLSAFARKLLSTAQYELVNLQERHVHRTSPLVRRAYAS